jgi:hypothetical protein
VAPAISPYRVSWAGVAHKKHPGLENEAMVSTPPVASPLTVVGVVLDVAPGTH